MGGRETVQCRIHANASLKALKLKQMNAIISSNLNTLCEFIVCSKYSQECMYRSCDVCKDNLRGIYHDCNTDSAETVTYFEWNNVTETKTTAKGEVITVKIVKKVEKVATKKQLCTAFEQDLQNLLPHQFRILHQFGALRAKKKNLTAEECVLQVDFSENYACKANEEIQSMHFGASRAQVTLHTCSSIINVMLGF